jgi:hypothetical protein
MRKFLLTASSALVLSSALIVCLHLSDKNGKKGIVAQPNANLVANSNSFQKPAGLDAFKQSNVFAVPFPVKAKSNEEVEIPDWMKRAREIDRKEGRNVDVQQREQELRNLTRDLRAGMTQAEAQALLGRPAKVGLTIERKLNQGFEKGMPTEDLFRSLDLPGKSFDMTVWFGENEGSKLPVSSTNQYEPVFIISPHPTKSTSVNLGDAFQILWLWFDAKEGRLIEWKWLTPQRRN